jgi:hypothetical protein
MEKTYSAGAGEARGRNDTVIVHLAPGCDVRTSAPLSSDLLLRTSEQLHGSDPGGGAEGARATSTMEQMDSPLAGTAIAVPGAGEGGALESARPGDSGLVQTYAVRTHALGGEGRLCLWCGHAPERPNTATGLPERMAVNGEILTSGFFCGDSCAAAANRSSAAPNYIKARRLSIINHMRGARGMGRVSPAPPRESLVIYGGWMTIEEFRACSGAVLMSCSEPVRHLRSEIEEVYENCITGGFVERFIPLDRDRLEKIRLKRTKPLYDNRFTLDHSMNLRVVARASAAAGE